MATLFFPPSMFGTNNNRVGDNRCCISKVETFVKLRQELFLAANPGATDQVIANNYIDGIKDNKAVSTINHFFFPFFALLHVG